LPPRHQTERFVFLSIFLKMILITHIRSFGAVRARCMTRHSIPFGCRRRSR
jgi:hypothetical protein